MIKKEKIICHVCGKIKKSYTIFMNNDIFSLIKHYQAREKGEICERCNNYFALTGEFKIATKKDFEIAKKADEFAELMLAWWIKDNKLTMGKYPEKDKRQFDGTICFARWCRKYLTKKGV